MKESNHKKVPIRVLHVLGSVQLGGAESRVMDLYRHMDRSRIQFDFLLHTKETGYFEQIYCGLPRLENNLEIA